MYRLLNVQEAAGYTKYAQEVIIALVQRGKLKYNLDVDGTINFFKTDLDDVLVPF